MFEFHFWHLRKSTSGQVIKVLLILIKTELNYRSFQGKFVLNMAANP